MCIKFISISLDFQHPSYRERVAAGKRVKLYKAELDQLILHFLDHLKELEDPHPIEALCQAEIALLEEGYQKNTVAFDYIPKYRKAIEAAITNEQITLTSSNSHHYIHTQRETGKKEERFEHYALTYFKYDQATYDALDSRNKATNQTKQLNLKGVNWRVYLEKLKELLHSKGKFAARHRAIAIAGLTGRRIGEVLARGEFTLSKHPYLLRFEGHSKTQRAAYDIVTLIEATELLSKIEQFRELDDIKPLLVLQGEELTGAINQFDVQVNRECKKFLGDIVPALEGKEEISVHNLRSLWGAIAAYFFCPPTSHEYPFLQHYLGHVIESAATGHYFRYRLIDEGGQYLEQRGIYIDEYGELPLPGGVEEVQPETTETAIPTTEVVESSPDVIITPLKTLDTLVTPDETSDTPVTPPETLNIPITPPETSNTPVTAQETEIQPSTLTLLPSVATDEPLSIALLNAVTEMFNSTHYTVLLAALMAVTGRSPGELIKSGTFAPIPHETFTLSFSPTGIGDLSPLVTLVNADAVRNAITRLREHEDVQNWRYKAPSEIDAHCLAYVTDAVQKHLPFADISEMFASYSRFTNGNVASLPSTASHPPTVSYKLSDNDQSRLSAIASHLGIKGTGVEVLTALFDWVEDKLQTTESLQSPQQQEKQQPEEKLLEEDKSVKAPLATTSGFNEDLAIAVKHQSTTLAWLTNRVESLEKQLKQLQKQRDEALTEWRFALAQSEQLRPLKEENQHLRQENQKLLETASRFEAARQAFLGQGQQLSLPLVIPESIQDNTSTSSSNNKTTTTPVTPPPLTSQRTPGKAVERARQIVEAIAQWNQSHPEDTWAINQGLLEQGFGINRKAGNEFLTQYTDWVEQIHNSSGVKNVRGHNRNKNIALLKAWVQEQLTHHH